MPPGNSSETLSPPKDVEKAEDMEQIAVNEGSRQEEVPLPSSQQSEKSDPFLVHLMPEESPKSFAFSKKIVIQAIISSGALCSTFASSIVRAPSQ